MVVSFEDFVNIVISNGGIVEGKPRIWDNVSLKFEEKSKNNRFFFAENSVVKNLSGIFYHGENYIEVGAKSKLTGLIKFGHGCKIIIGKDVTFTGAVKFYLSENTKLTIGDDCMFGMDVKIYTHDFHPLFDLKTNKRINYSRDIEVGSHVWVGNEAVLLKGCSLNNGSVLGAYSVCGTKVPENSLGIGNPTRVVKSDIRWTRDSLNTTIPFGMDQLK